MRNALTNCVLGIGLIVILNLGGALALDFGSKVVSGDADEGRILESFPGVTGLAPTIAFLDVSANPGVFDLQDVVYFDFDGDLKVDANDLRLTDFDCAHVAGTKVKPADPDFGANLETFADPAGQIYYANFGGGPGYDNADPVYIKTSPLPKITDSLDVRLTDILYSAGSKVNATDIDYGKPLTLMVDASAGAIKLGLGPVAELRFYNANGNVNAMGSPIYDGLDSVYLDISYPGPGSYGTVSPNDVRLSSV